MVQVFICTQGGDGGDGGDGVGEERKRHQGGRGAQKCVSFSVIAAMVPSPLSLASQSLTTTVRGPAPSLPRVLRSALGVVNFWNFYTVGEEKSCLRAAARVLGLPRHLPTARWTPRGSEAPSPSPATQSSVLDDAWTSGSPFPAPTPGHGDNHWVRSKETVSGSAHAVPGPLQVAGA